MSKFAQGVSRTIKMWTYQVFLRHDPLGLIHSSFGILISAFASNSSSSLYSGLTPVSGREDGEMQSRYIDLPDGSNFFSKLWVSICIIE